LSERVAYVDFYYQICYTIHNLYQGRMMLELLFPGIAGATPVIADNGSMPDQISLINAINAQNPWPATAYSIATNTTAFTASGAQIAEGQETVLDLTGTLGAGAALTLPTVANLLASFTPNQQAVGSSIVLRVINHSSVAFTWTVTTNTGWTLNGAMTVAQSTFRDFILNITAIGATPTATLTQIGTGTAG
jgi:hypothetical protein